jgi:hypothetical protein
MLSSGDSKPAAVVEETVYPALLSQVAQQFQLLIQVSTHTKDMLEYPDCFQGKKAVDLIGKIIKSKDRNVSILIGRALDAQGFFHDVTWTHRLRDSSNEYYKLDEVREGGFLNEFDDSIGIFYSSFLTSRYDGKTMISGHIPLPNGVFTLLTDCYSPTCSREKPCYSVTCPRKFDEKFVPSANSALAKQAVEKVFTLFLTLIGRNWCNLFTLLGINLALILGSLPSCGCLLCPKKSLIVYPKRNWVDRKSSLKSLRLKRNLSKIWKIRSRYRILG